jgi:hypothetical protein
MSFIHLSQYDGDILRIVIDKKNRILSDEEVYLRYSFLTLVFLKWFTYEYE